MVNDADLHGFVTLASGVHWTRAVAGLSQIA